MCLCSFQTKVHGQSSSLSVVTRNTTIKERERSFVTRYCHLFGEKLCVQNAQYCLFLFQPCDRQRSTDLLCGPCLHVVVSLMGGWVVVMVSIRSTQQCACQLLFQQQLFAAVVGRRRRCIRRTSTVDALSCYYCTRI